MKMIIADGRESFELHVASLQLPLVVLLEQQGSDEPDDRSIVWKDADDVRPALDLCIDAFERVRRRNLRSVRFREVHEREDIEVCVFEHHGKFGTLATELFDDRVPIARAQPQDFLEQRRY